MDTLPTPAKPFDRQAFADYISHWVKPDCLQPVVDAAEYAAKMHSEHVRWQDKVLLT
jgi:hypothetical protein